MVTTRGTYPRLSLPFITGVSVPSQKSIRSCICVFGISNKRQRTPTGQLRNGQSRETGNTGHTRRKNQKHKTIYVGNHYAEANTNNANKSWALLQTSGGKDEPDIVCMRKSLRTSHQVWFYTIFLLDFLIVPTVSYFFFPHFIASLDKISFSHSLNICITAFFLGPSFKCQFIYIFLYFISCFCTSTSL